MAERMIVACQEGGVIRSASTAASYPKDSAMNLLD
jgi:hypothetical protein